jgi:hypothetical protein
LTHPSFTKPALRDSSLEPHRIYFDNGKKEGFQGIIERNQNFEKAFWCGWSGNILQHHSNVFKKVSSLDETLIEHIFPLRSLFQQELAQLLLIDSNQKIKPGSAISNPRLFGFLSTSRPQINYLLIER